jgi:DNA-binding HxlR family transcriptional regulator
LAAKKVYIEFGTPIQKWAADNRGIIMDSIYDNVFDFISSKSKNKIILKLVAKPKEISKLKDVPPGLIVDFSISKEDIDQTLDRLMEYMIEVEAYEKCAEIKKLQNSLN